MKIAILCFYKGIIPRGVETFVDELSSNLTENHDVTVFQSGYESNKKYKIVQIQTNNKSLRNTEKSILRKLFLDKQSIKIAVFTLKTLPHLLKENNDIIIPTNGGWQTLFCKIISLTTRAKLVVSGQSGKGFDDRWNLLCRPDVFVALSKRDEQWAKRYSKNVVFIPNGVDLEKFNPNITKVNLPLKKPIVLCVSALTAQKRVELAVKAVAVLKDVSLLIVGYGDKEQEEKINKLGKELLGERFLLTKTTHEEISSYYNTASVFTLPSNSSESFGIVIVEAMASNLPIVATFDEVRKDIVGNAGILIDPENLINYSNALKEALTKNWGNLPRLQSEKYSWDKICKKYEEVFKQITL